MSITRVVLAGFVVLACAVHAPAQSSVSVRFEDGRVTLSARNAPLRTILAEWSRVGGSKIVNAERIAGQPLTLELTGVTERDALSVLLRSVSGYIVAPRVGQIAGRSSFDRIFILPTSAPVRATPAAASAQPAAMNPLVFVPGAPDEDGDVTDGLPRTAPVQRDPQQIQQQLREAAERAAALRDATEVDEAADEPATAAPGRRTTTPANPFGGVQGSTRPGEITPAPQQQTQPGSPR
jgi:hypothetical protein